MKIILGLIGIACILGCLYNFVCGLMATFSRVRKYKRSADHYMKTSFFLGIAAAVLVRFGI